MSQDTTEQLYFHFSLSCIGKGNGNPPVFLPGESQGQWSLVGCHLWGRTELDTTEAMQQQQQSQKARLELLRQFVSTVTVTTIYYCMLPVYHHILHSHKIWVWNQMIQLHAFNKYSGF